MLGIVYGLLANRIATCSNGLLSGTRYLGDARNCGTMSGLVNEHSILFQYGDATSHGSR